MLLTVTMKAGSVSLSMSISVLLSMSSSLVQVSCSVKLNTTLTHLTDGVVYPVKFQPGLNGFNVRAYFWNSRLVKFQIRCFFYGSACDLVGRWAKPRMITGFLGGCEKCTKEQGNWLEIVLETIADRYPIMFRALVAKFLEYLEIKVPRKERQLIAQMFE